FVVRPAEAGRTLAAVLKARLGLSWSQARRLVELRRVRLAGQVCADPVRRVRAGQRIEMAELAPRRHGGHGGKTKEKMPPLSSLRALRASVVPSFGPAPILH